MHNIYSNSIAPSHPFAHDINGAIEQLHDLVHPQSIYLFGSCVGDCVKSSSDIDLCLIVDYQDKRELLTYIHMNIDLEKNLDILLCTPEQWEQYKSDQGNILGIINATGVKVYG